MGLALCLTLLTSNGLEFVPNSSLYPAQNERKGTVQFKGKEHVRDEWEVR